MSQKTEQIRKSYCAICEERRQLIDNGTISARHELIIHETGLRSNLLWHNLEGYTLFWTVYYNSSPGGIIKINKQEIELKPDRLLFIPGSYFFQRHSPQIIAKHLWISFSYNHKMTPRQQIPVEIRLNDTLSCLLRDLLQELEDGLPPEVTYRTTSALLSILLNDPQLEWDKPMPENFRRVIVKIQANPGYNWSLGKLAATAGTGEKTISRMFIKHLGVNPAVYIARQRIRHAIKLMSIANLNIDETAELTGFSCRESFSRAFKRIAGLPPREFLNDFMSEK